MVENIKTVLLIFTGMVINIPIFLLLGKLFFGTWDRFKTCWKISWKYNRFKELAGKFDDGAME